MLTPVTKPSVRVTEIGEYIHYQSCDRRFKLEHNNRKLGRELPFAERLFNSLDPVLQEAGRLRENEWETSLQKNGLIDLTLYSQKSADEKKTPWTTFVAQLQGISSGQRAYGREISLEADEGAFQIKGQIDFVLILWEADRPKLRIVECKASRRDRTYHRVQVALYRMLVRQLIQVSPVAICGVELRPEDIECVVARIDESTNKSQLILDLKPFKLDTEEADINRLLASEGALNRVVQADLADLDYQIDPKCDGCVFNIHCLSESARLRRLELIGLDPSAVRVLRAAGIDKIDDLAELDLDGQQAVQVRHDPSFSDNLELIQLKAKTRRRTLPGGNIKPDSYEVTPLPYAGQGQLPEHIINGERLIRVYLSVDYDYVENRIGALAAHVTKSEGQLHTSFTQVNGHWQPDPTVKERWEVERDRNNRPVYEERSLQSKEVIEFQTSPWTGEYREDTGAEKQLIQAFLKKLVEVIDEVAEAETAPIHFYVWSRSEMDQLLEGCSRVSSQLLANLRELLGCRESLEQLIYSCLHDEVDRRFALGWTGRGLAVVTSLSWFGRRYHWRRRVSGVEVDLEQAFTQDIFDFKTDLDLDAQGQWAERDSEQVSSHKFEIRSRFYDSLTAPYWRAYWRKLPDPTDPNLSLAVAKAIERYNSARKPNYLNHYFRARVHALRWVEESIRFKNPEIVKPSLVIANLLEFTLGVDNAAQAGIDYLRLDQHVKVTNWIATHLVPPVYRVPLGRTIPISDVVSHGNNRLTATINLDRYGINYEVLETNCTIEKGNFVRISPCFNDPHRGQTFGQLLRGGSTCVVDNIDWETRQIELSVRQTNKQDRYQLPGRFYKQEEEIFSYATLDESPSDFVAGKVDDRLISGFGNHVCQWFDPERPQIPPQQALAAQKLEQYQNLLQSLTLPNGQKLATDQVAAAVSGLTARIQLLQGPPGTGKTQTTAIATFLRILARCSIGDIVLIAAPTHTAVNNLLLRLDSLLPILQQQADQLGLTVPPIKLSRVDPKEDESFFEKNVECFRSKGDATRVNQMRSNAVLVIGGTTSALLKLSLEIKAIQVPLLIVDEASMMVFPHFLSLATLVKIDGEIMLAGDHRQLSPIVAHNWEQEDRPPIQLYKPYVSAFEAVKNIKITGVTDSAILSSALSFTFRLPPLICGLISRIYRMDNIELKGRSLDSNSLLQEELGGLLLVLHSERQSKRSNMLEVGIIKKIIEAAKTKRAIENKSVAIVTPHRAQRTLLKNYLNDSRDLIDVIDTVESLQGDERPYIIVSATASDPSAISKNVEFILDLNRSNVAFSRAQKQLIVVCSKTLLDHIPAELEHYEETMLWKSLRSVCSELIGKEMVDGHQVEVFMPPPDILEKLSRI
ncbi:AAA domain-containing protein [Microcoleus sp. D3_18a_C4]|uniref:AAA domain-containing protein n=1 Tax=Microcoleus sp. D3_18a_C4 TaxID=3055332 RepID=UPI002FD659AA